MSDTEFNSSNPTSSGPGLGVHVLSEFVFCKRAGLITVEQGREDEGEDEEERRASVNYMPHYEWDALLRDIESTTRSMTRWMPVPFVSLAVTIAVGWWLGWCPAVVGVLVTMCMATPVFTAMERLRKLKEDYDDAMSRKPAEPDPTNEADQKIGWWELRKAGFESFLPPRKYIDEDLHLGGRPRRILRRGNTLIPVFKTREDGAEEIQPKHYVRIAAYCHLLEKAASAESPYGIVLFGSTFRGKALNARAARTFLGVVEEARLAISQAREGIFPKAPNPRNCHGCPYGKPFVVRRATGSLSDTVSRLKVLGIDGREYRSDCGDRFDWIPPHDKAVDKQLAEESASTSAA